MANITPSPSDEIRKRLQDRFKGVPLVWTTPLLNNRCWVFDIDLTEEHNDEKLGLEEWLKSRGVEYATFMTIIEAASEWSFKVNTSNAPAVDAVVGDEWEAFEIHEIYYTNEAGVGSGSIHIEWRAP